MISQMLRTIKEATHRGDVQVRSFINLVSNHQSSADFLDIELLLKFQVKAYCAYEYCLTTHGT